MAAPPGAAVLKLCGSLGQARHRAGAVEYRIDHLTVNLGNCTPP